MRIIIFLVALFLATDCFALQRVYYNKTLNKEINDISGLKTLDDIKREFGPGEYQVININESVEGTRVKNGNLEKYNHIEENEAIKKDKDKIKKQKAETIKNKLGLSDDDLETLKEIIK